MAKTWKDRLVKESDKLDKRLNELTSFVAGTHGEFEKLPEPDRDLLMTQQAIMTAYFNVLILRMKRLGLMECEDCGKKKEKMVNIFEMIDGLVENNKKPQGE